MTHFFETYGLMLGKAIFVHLAYVLTSVAAATVVALVLGVLLSRVPGDCPLDDACDLDLAGRFPVSSLSVSSIWTSAWSRLPPLRRWRSMRFSRS